ncbi:MAG: flagellinolysin [Bacillus sp. (in: Bacteria)]|nr:flagellinolysin [Bacillus sp. (in: firmicutes)]
MISIKSNMLAMNANRQFGINNKKDAKSVEKLSSGYSINRAADNAAGLAISEKMRRQIRGLTQASANAQDGISMVQSAEGALNELHAMLQRANELSVKAANGTWLEDDRDMIDAELQQLKNEINTTAKHTVFNEIRLFPEDGIMPGASSSETFNYTFYFDAVNGSYHVESMNDIAQGVNRAAVNPTSDGKDLANYIAQNMIPNAAKQIFDTFPSIANDIGNGQMDIKITVTNIDGKNSVLARAGYRYYTSGGTTKRGFDLTIEVDSADFVAADASGTGSRVTELYSTIAHEFMHSVMQYTMTDGMSGRNGDKFPEWFVEGTAQLSGGGFPTNWNNDLISYIQHLSNENDSSQDANITNYLKKYTAASRPYGHGYLAAAYAGYLANGKGAVTAENIATGMDKIFADLIGGKKFANAIKDNTGYSVNDLNQNLFKNGDADLVEFVRKLTYASRGNGANGAGSIITTGLNVGGMGILGGNSIPTPNPGPNPNPGPGPNPNPGPNPTPTPTGGRKSVDLQVGADSGQHIRLELYRMDTVALGLEDTNVKTQESAGDAIDEIKEAIRRVSTVRSSYGAVQNRLEHTIANLDNIIENITASESLIRDTDIAKEMVTHSNQQIMLQAGQSVLSQANHASDIILSLLA